MNVDQLPWQMSILRQVLGQEVVLQASTGKAEDVRTALRDAQRTFVC